MRYILLWIYCFSLVFIPQKQTFGQCPITVDAGMDVFVCNPGESAMINGSVSGNFLDFSWDPIAGLDNPFSLTPNATITGLTTYTLTAYAEDPSAPNLVNNPGFESGNAGFTSSYTFDPTPITPGTYVITTSPALVFANFPPCDDHTFGNGTGNMMLCNGTGSQADVWCQTIPVNPDTYYVMSGWITASPISPPEIQFSVNGLLVGNPFISSGVPCGWEQFSATWFSGPNATATVCVTDQNGSGNGLFGDDFALDDLYFAEACSESDEVMVDIAEVDAVLSPTTILPCNALPGGIQIDGSTSTTGPNISYEWDGPSVVAGGNTNTATVNEPGTYSLTVTYNDGFVFCSDMATIEVIPDPNFVLAFATVPHGLDCINTLVTLDGSGTFEGPTISYEWSPVAGIVSGQNTLFPNVNQGGTYTLLVTNSISGCTATAEVTVDETKDNPIAIANAQGPITCTDSVQVINGTGSSTGNDFEYEWSVLNFGNIIFGENTLDTCVVDTAGIYQLLVTNIANGCTSTDTIEVQEAINLPQAVAIAGDDLGCSINTTTITAVDSLQGDSIIYVWMTTNGNIISADTTTTITVDLAGDYILTAIDTLSGCIATDTATILGNAGTPIAEAGEPVDIDCNGTPQSLNGTGSSTGNYIIQQWVTINGNIMNGDTTLMPTITSPGTYFLIVTDTLNGCFSIDSVQAMGNGNAPTAIVEIAEMLDCNNNTIEIDGSNSSSGSNISISWFSPTGNFVSGDTTLTPSVDAPGIYTLTLTNTDNGCTSSIAIEVEQDINEPTLAVEPPVLLTCLITSDTLDASTSSQGANFLTNWTTNNGLITSGDTTLMPVVTAPGIYTLTVTNIVNGCSASIDAVVFEDIQAPIADAGSTQSLNCIQNTAQLDGSASSQNGPFHYQWSTVVGNILSGINSLTPTINQEGIYILEVTDTTNGCSATAGVAVDLLVDFPQAAIESPDTLTCTVTEIIITADASAGTNFLYEWQTTNGNISIGSTSLNPTVNASGMYELTVTDTINGCAVSDTVFVYENTVIPIAEAGDAFTLSCAVTNAILDGSASSTGGLISYLWTTSNGNIVSNIDTQAPTINAPGDYQLLVTDNQNGCTATDVVTISQDANAPIADAGQTDSLTCNTTTLSLNGSASSIGNAFIYQWTTQNGNLIGGATTLMPQIDTPGTYVLTVLDTTNDCQTLASVQILDATAGPAVTVIDIALLTCLDTLITLTANASNVSYQWSTNNGNINSGETTATPVVDAPGLYELIVVDLNTGCTASASSLVEENTEFPTINLQFPMPLTCEIEFVNISGWGSSSGPGYSHVWTTQNGQIAGDNMQTQAIASAPGDYTFTVTNLSNGCSAAATLTVVENLDLPDAVASAPDQLGCGQTEVTLDGTGSSTGSEFNYFWATPNGNIVSGGSTLAPVVNEPGEYYLIVLNNLNGCSQTDTVTVSADDNAPSIVIAQPDELNCILENITLDANGSSSGLDYQIVWTTFNGNILSGDDTLVPIIDAGGDYILTITNTQNGCTAADTITVVENIAVPILSAGSDLTLDCNNESVILQGELFAPQAANANWSFIPAMGAIGDPFLTSSTILNPTINLPGQYTLTIIDPTNGCSAQDSMHVNSIALESFDFEIIEPTCEIPTGSIEFIEVVGGTAPFEYSIDGQLFSSQELFDGLEAGAYELSVMDAAGCQLITSTNLQDFQPFEVIISPIQSTTVGELVHLNAIVTLPPDEINNVIWTPYEGLSCMDCLDPFLVLTQDVSYTLEVTDVNGCSALAQIDIAVTAPTIDIFVPNVFSPNDDGINDRLVIFSKENLIANVKSFSVFSRWGETVFEGFDFPANDFEFGWDGTHRGERLNSGVFTWMAEVQLVNGETKLLAGDVVIIQ